MSFNDRHVAIERGISDVGCERFTRTMLPKNAVSVVCIGATIGKICMTTAPTLTNQQINSIICDEKRANPNFVYYSLRLKRDELAAKAAGAATPIINKSTFEQIEIELPAVDIQSRIAEILSAYDDLIEVNTRRIALLEEMVFRIFKATFDGGGETWSLGTIGELSQYVSRGIAPKYDDNSETVVINQKCIRNGRVSLVPARRQSRVPPEKLVRRFDVLINSTGVGTLGRVAQVMTFPYGTAVDTHVTIVRAATDVDPHFFGVQILSRQSDFERAGVGSTGQTELSRAAISETPVAIPPKRLRDEFGRLAAPLREQAEVLSAQIVILTAARDLLLPKLISGEIDLEQARRDVDRTIPRVAVA
jgi:type I restriction enzyme S subunit